MDKVCSKCLVEKSVSRFHRGGAGIRKSWCKSCTSAHWKEKNSSEVEKVRRKMYRLKSQFGLTVEDFQRMCAIQNYQCAICKRIPTDRALDVDHCHTTGKVRGLLCKTCNMGLGNFFDSTMNLKSTIEYLELKEKENGKTYALNRA